MRRDPITKETSGRRLAGGLDTLLAVALLVAGPGVAPADIGPPALIRMPVDRTQAVSGQVYDGEFAVEFFSAGTVTGFELVGEGWTTIRLESPTNPLNATPGTIQVPFRALPADADQSVGLRFKFNGRDVQRKFRIGPAAFAGKGKPRLLVSASGRAAAEPTEAAVQLPSGPDTRGGTIVVEGRIVFDRTGRDRSIPPDGDFNDPGDIQPVTVGADGAVVQLWDVDDLSANDLMWSGVTDEFGRFASPALDTNVDDGSEPDLKLVVIARRPDETGVIDPNEDDFYFWETPEIENYGGNSYDFGTLRPQNSADQHVLHILTNIVRTSRYIYEIPNYSTPPVRVISPVEEWSHYQPATQEIYLFSEHSWNDDTIIHEFGHHFVLSLHVPPQPDYGNGICDAGTPEGDCFPNGGTWPPGNGHCGWCRENPSDAWNEGWPNWLADVTLRYFAERYEFEVGGPMYVPLFPSNYDTPFTCCVDGMPHDPLRTEGFAAALLRDIDDETCDDHDADGVRDLLCVGVEPIFDTLANELPTTVAEFISAFRTRYPQQAGSLYATAFNVGGAAYVTGFPSDSQPPGVVAVCDSPSHPLGIGGALPCMRIEWEPAPDAASGATHYSYTFSQSPGGLEPDASPDAVVEAGDCRIAALFGWASPGDLYFSIKACDAAGNWSDEFVTFGPFTIVDCNGSGFLDLCDLACQSDGIPGCSFPLVCAFPPGSGCAQSLDCNGNYVPDECDVAQGTSQDCNRDGIPDECQAGIIKHFTGAESQEWGATANWQEGAEPVDGDHVCIPTGTPQAEVTFSEDFRRVSTLNCDIDFRIQGTSAELRVDQPSYVSGDLSLLVGSTLRSMTSLDVGGELIWQGHEIHGPGTVNVLGGLHLSSPVARPALRNSAHLSILAGDVFINGNEYIELYDASSFSIGQPVTYTYDGNFNIFVGGPTTVVNVAGALVRASGSNTANIRSFVLNSGLIHNRSGALTLTYGGIHAGELRGDPDTAIRLYAQSGTTYSFQSNSTINAHDLIVGFGPTIITGSLNVLDGLTLVEGGTCTVTSIADVASYGRRLDVDTGSAQLNAPVSGSSPNFDTVLIGETGLQGGCEARFNTGQTISVDWLELRKGDIHGADPIVINDAFTWGTGGGQVGAGGTITSNGAATIQGNASSRSLNRTFNNTATATFLGAFGGNGTFNNLATATMELRGDSTGITSGIVNNAGSITKTVGTGSSTLNRINNTGVIRAQVGEIAFNGAGGFTSTNNGTIIGDPGTLLRFSNIHEMTPASSLTADAVRFSNAATNIRGAVNIAGTLTMDAGTCTFTNEADVASYGQHLFLRTGTIRFEAPTTGPVLAFDTVIVGELNAEGDKVARFGSGQPVSIGALNLVEGNIEGVDPITIYDSFVWGTGGGSILAGGAITCNGPATIQGAASSRNLFRVFNNAGYATFQGGFSGGSGAAFNNIATGTIDIRNTGTVMGLGASATLDNAGALIKSAGNVSTISNHFRNSGTVDLRTGVLQLTGTSGITNIQTAGQTILSGGGLAITAPGSYQVQGGELTGTGVVTGNVTNSGGRLKPGLSAGILTISSAYVQQAPGAMEIEIGGAAPGLFDLVHVGGAAALGGELHVKLIDDFVPATGNTFVVLTASSINGTFATLTGAPGFTLSYTPTQVVLTYNAPNLPADLDGDCDVDINDLATLLSNYGTESSATHDMGDVDGNGNVDLSDLAALLSQFGTVCP
ncbi:MAG: hypothetical protein AMXMBFR47_39310 [Planctomycetota bacterium]